MTGLTPTAARQYVGRRVSFSQLYARRSVTGRVLSAARSPDGGDELRILCAAGKIWYLTPDAVRLLDPEPVRTDS